MFVEPLPPPFQTKEEAEKAFEAFIEELHKNVDDEVNDFADEFVTRMYPELAGSMRHVLLTDMLGGSIDALEESPEYMLHYAHVSEVVGSIFLRIMNDFGPNIYGTIQHKEAKRERALVGAP